MVSRAHSELFMNVPDAGTFMYGTDQVLILFVGAENEIKLKKAVMITENYKIISFRLGWRFGHSHSIRAIPKQKWVEEQKRNN